MKQWAWAVIGPGLLVLAVGAAFAHVRLKLDHAESISRVERKASEINKSALTCLSQVGARLLVARNSLPDLSAESVSREFEDSLNGKNRCEAAIFVTSDRELILSVPSMAHLKYADLPVWAWGTPDRVADDSSALLPLVEGPYENASQDWYVIVRVPYKSNADGWIASVVPLNRLFDQRRLKEILDQDVGIRISDIGLAEKKNVSLINLGSGPFMPLIRQEVPLGQNSLVLEFSPGINSLLWRSSLVYGSLILIIALTAGVLGYEFTAEQGRLKHEIKVRDRSLREVKTQLNEVIRGARTSEDLSIGAAYQDVITGLPNWLYFMAHLERSLQRHGGTGGEGMTVVLTELDGLIAVQRRLDTGELTELLSQVVRRFEDKLRPADLMAARLGQGEFAFLLFNSGNDQAENYLLSHLAEAMEESFVVNEKTIILSTTSGVANSREFPEALQMIQQAESQLLKAKLKTTKNQVAPDPLVLSRATEGRELTDVRTAIERDELRLDYLPIVNLETRQVVGLEVLVRWHHPFKGIISPSRFIPLAEAAGHGIFLTKWVLNESIQQLADWRRRLPGIDDIFISVNLTPHEFARAGLVGTIEALLEETALPANRLQLELDEEILGGDVKLAVDLSQRLQKMGIKLSFEEFGAAHSALSSLRLVKWNFAKVATRFGAGLATSEEQQQTLRALTHMAQDLHIDCVAKAVETEQAAVQFAGLGYKFAQGFLFHRPIPATTVEGILKKRFAG